MRLSLSLDGKATLVSADSSPPRMLTPRPSSSGHSVISEDRLRLRRQKASSFGLPQDEATSASPTIPSLQRGRSRDARNWELCCDPEAREERIAQTSLGVTHDELTTQAENESKGSAVAAISLLRSSSSTTLKTNANKRNSLSITQVEKVGKTKKVKQGSKGTHKRQERIQKALSRISSESTKGNDIPISPTGSSDKENLAPGEIRLTQKSHRRALPAAPSGKSHQKQKFPRAILGENNSIPAHANLDGPSNSRNKRRKLVQSNTAVFEDADDNDEEEVKDFMKGEISPGKKGDLDCVQGLLSLSQGNWR